MGKINISAAVLAGGDSKRMNRDKSLMTLGSKTMIEHVVNKLREISDEIIIVTDTSESYCDMFDDVIFRGDQIKTPEKNSFVGLYSGILTSKNDYTFIVACDMPFLNLNLIKEMVKLLDGQDVLVPMLDGYYQPLHAIYKKSCLGIAKQLILNGQYKISNLIDSDNLSVDILQEDFILKFDPYLYSFLNINTYEEFLRAKKIYKFKCRK